MVPQVWLMLTEMLENVGNNEISTVESVNLSISLVSLTKSLQEM